MCYAQKISVSGCLKNGDVMQRECVQLSNYYLLTKIYYIFKNKLTHIIKNDLGKFVLCLFFLCAFSCFSLLGGGFNLYVKNIIFIFVIFLLPLLVFNYQVFRNLIVLHGIVSILYLPAGRIWGRMNNNILSSIVGTNFSESKDFFSLITYRCFIEQIIFLIVLFLLLRTAKYIKIFNKNQSEIFSLGYTLVYIFMYISVYMFAYTWMIINSRYLDIDYLPSLYPHRIIILFIFIIVIFEYKKWSEKPFLSVIYLTLFSTLFIFIYIIFLIALIQHSFIPNSLIYYDTYYAYQDYQNNRLARINADKSNKWELTEPYTPKYKNYVLVIGESMRQDYMSVYGYPLKTTPFLDSVNGIFIDAYYSTAAYTDNSLMHSLYWKQDNKMADNRNVFFGNIIQLAKKAGLKTYWISNNNSGWTAQITPLAQQSDYVDLRDAESMKDDELLLKLQNILQNQYKLKENSNVNLFIIHLYGQHEPFCEKLKSKPQFKVNIDDIDCYLQSIYETDQIILKQLTKTLEQYGSYSIMYFSDHGLRTAEKISNKQMTLLHADYNHNYRQNFLVPMFKISSDDNEHKIIKTQKSGFNFIYAFTEWLGVREKHLNQNYCFWCEIEDENIQVLVYNQTDRGRYLHYDGNAVLLNQLLEDPAIISR